MITTGKFAALFATAFVAVSPLVLACSIFATAVARPAWAADANDLVAEGIRLRRASKDQQALAVFKEAVRQQASPRALAQLGLCEQALGLWAPAESHIQAALKQADDPWIRKNAQALGEALKVVQASLGSIDAWGTPSGAEISLDGEVAGSLPLAHPLRAAEGSHVLVVKAPNYLPERRVVNVRAGELRREHVALAPAEGTPSPRSSLPRAESPDTTTDTTTVGVTPVGQPSSDTSAEADTPSSEPGLPTWRLVLPWSLATGAVLAAVFGVWQHVAWRNGVKKFDAIAACGRSAPMKGSDPQCQGLWEDYTSAQTGTFVGYGVAGVFGAGAATVFILNAMTDNTAGDRTVQVALGPGGTGLSLITTF